MTRLVALFVALLAVHLGQRDRRKGSHRQATHGNRYRMSGGKRVLRRAGGSKGSGKSSGGSSSSSRRKDSNDDDPFAPEPGEDENEDTSDAEREKYERQMLATIEREERSTLYRVIQEAGGIQTRDDLREEYRGIPNTYKRRDGMPGDEMAEYLDMYYPELGIRDERDLIDFFAA